VNIFITVILGLLSTISFNAYAFELTTKGTVGDANTSEVVLQEMENINSVFNEKINQMNDGMDDLAERLENIEACQAKGKLYNKSKGKCVKVKVKAQNSQRAGKDEQKGSCKPRGATVHRSSRTRAEAPGLWGKTCGRSKGSSSKCCSGSASWMPAGNRFACKCR